MAHVLKVLMRSEPISKNSFSSHHMPTLPWKKYLLAQSELCSVGAILGWPQMARLDTYEVLTSFACEMGKWLRSCRTSRAEKRYSPRGNTNSDSLPAAQQLLPARLLRARVRSIFE